MKIEVLSISQLLSGKVPYAIPIYQRNYAWGAKEIEQLIQDIIDFAGSPGDKSYYIGTLVVSAAHKKDQNYFDVIDGQQRLTTLSILTAVIRNLYPEIELNWFQSLNLKFLSREKSLLSLRAIYDNELETAHQELNIIAAYHICAKELKRRTEGIGMSVQQFTDYLFHYVKVLQVPLPEGIDLNHYFEIMNSRGEQLEKHEILKAKLMNSFNDLENREALEACFDLIWEGCSDMESYIQSGFSVTQRDLIFAQQDWNRLVVSSFDEFVEKMTPTLTAGGSADEQLISDILSSPQQKAKSEVSDDVPDRFNSVINFQNFLLHVLRVKTRDADAALDDKRLIPIFENFLPHQAAHRLSFVKQFIFDLLKSKLLFDKYIIKREFNSNTDRWSLKSLRWYSSGNNVNGVKYTNTFPEGQTDPFDADNWRILMLLSMFHVSLPSMSYKYWLNAALNYLFSQFEVESKYYISYLEYIAKSFVFDRYLCNTGHTEKRLEYQEIVYQDLARNSRDRSMIDTGKMYYHNIENNLVFNFLDYLLWLDLKDTDKDSRVRSFEFTFRSSVEHYYPQTPINDEIPKMDEVYLHSFGNLCLISHEKNSRYSNYTPRAKYEQYGPSVALDSIKQYLMMKEPIWLADDVVRHQQAMLHIFYNHLDSYYQPSNEVSLAQKWFQEYRSKNPYLLARALLCFGDCTRQVSGDKYTFMDFDYIRQSDAYGMFEAYIDAKMPGTLDEIINDQLLNDELRSSFRYPLINYPKLLSYSSQGNFLWRSDGREIILLAAQKNTTYKAKNFYGLLIEDYLSKKLGVVLYCLSDGLYVNLTYSDGYYHVVNARETAALVLFICTNDNTSVNYRLASRVNGNSAAVKSLIEYDWERNKDGNFYRFGNEVLNKLGDNWEKNIFKVLNAVDKLFKNGFGIKLS
jgi:hypothetical protein